MVFVCICYQLQRPSSSVDQSSMSEQAALLIWRAWWRIPLTHRRTSLGIKMIRWVSVQCRSSFTILAGSWNKSEPIGPWGIIGECITKLGSLNFRLENQQFRNRRNVPLGSNDRVGTHTQNRSTNQVDQARTTCQWVRWWPAMTYWSKAIANNGKVRCSMHTIAEQLSTDAQHRMISKHQKCRHLLHPSFWGSHQERCKRRVSSTW
jgi:hypothetical protein